MRTDLLGVRWRKARRSSATGDSCVELAQLPGRIAVRDSKNPGAGHLEFNRAEIAGLARRVRSGALDL